MPRPGKPLGEGSCPVNNPPVPRTSVPGPAVNGRLLAPCGTVCTSARSGSPGAVAALWLAGSVLAGTSLPAARRKGCLSFAPAPCPRNRGWPHAGGATALVLEPLDFLRRLAALVSFPYTHQTRYHGIFANRSKVRGLLPPPPPSRHAPDIEAPRYAADVQERGDQRERIHRTAVRPATTKILLGPTSSPGAACRRSRVSQMLDRRRRPSRWLCSRSFPIPPS